MHRLNDLADVCRRAGLQVTEVQGWQTRGRGGDGGKYRPDLPSCVMVHHTASTTAPNNDVAYMTFNSPVAPIANLGLDRTGRVWVMAAGPTNTNGKGGPLPGCPINDMNRHAIGIEGMNGGTGEPWPQAQQNAYVTLVAALCDAYDIPAAQVYAHHEYAPGRKIDPYGPAKYGPKMWDMNLFRSDVSKALTGDTPEPGGPLVATKMTVMNPPTRLIDTRKKGGKFNNETRQIEVPYGDAAVAATVTITLTQADQLGHATVWADDKRPTTSCCNIQPELAANSNTTITPLSGGRFKLHVVGKCHVVVDYVALHHN